MALCCVPFLVEKDMDNTLPLICAVEILLKAVLVRIKKIDVKIGHMCHVTLIKSY